MNYEQASKAFDFLMSRGACLAAAELAYAERLEVEKIYFAMDAIVVRYFTARFACVQACVCEASAAIANLLEMAVSEEQAQVIVRQSHETGADHHARGFRASNARSSLNVRCVATA